MDYSKLVEMLKEWAEEKAETKYPDNLYCEYQVEGINLAKWIVKTQIEMFEDINKALL
jgi:hypothetical protein